MLRFATSKLTRTTCNKCSWCYGILQKFKWNDLFLAYLYQRNKVRKLQNFCFFSLYLTITRLIRIHTVKTQARYCDQNHQNGLRKWKIYLLNNIQKLCIWYHLNHIPLGYSMIFLKNKNNFIKFYQNHGKFSFSMIFIGFHIFLI